MIASLQSLQFQIQTWHNLCVNDYCFCSYSISKVLFLTVILMQRRRPPRPAEARAAAGQWQGGQLPAAGDSAVRCRKGAGSCTATPLHCYTALHSLLHSSLHTQWSVTGNSGLHYKSSRPLHLKIAFERGLGAQEKNYQGVSIGHGVSVNERPTKCWYCQTGGKQTNFVDDELEMCVSSTYCISWTCICLVNERWEDR